MKDKSYRIYIIKQHYDDELGAMVQKWTLSDSYVCRRFALYKARKLALSGDYARIEVVYRETERNKKTQSRVLWSHDRHKNNLALRLRQKTSFIRRKVERQETSK